MSKNVECFYTLSSPWMYLGGKQLSEIIKRHGANLVLRPYDFAPARNRARIITRWNWIVGRCILASRSS